MFSDPKLAEFFGESMGFVLKAPGQKSLYFAGDTILHDYVEIALKKYKPILLLLMLPKLSMKD